MIKRAVLRVRVVVAQSTLKCPDFEVCQRSNDMLVKWKGPGLNVITGCLEAHQERSHLPWDLWVGYCSKGDLSKGCVPLKGCNRLITHHWNSLKWFGYAEQSSVTKRRQHDYTIRVQGNIALSDERRNNRTRPASYQEWIWQLNNKWYLTLIVSKWQ